MRMWMTNPKIMCNKHLLGEHVELHMFVGSIKKKIGLDGYVKNKLLELKSIHSRHKELSIEMINRGMKHSSPLDVDVDISFYPNTVIESVVPREWSKNELLNRCIECKRRYDAEQGIDEYVDKTIE